MHDFLLLLIFIHAKFFGDDHKDSALINSDTLYGFSTFSCLDFSGYVVFILYSYVRLLILFLTT